MQTCDTRTSVEMNCVALFTVMLIEIGLGSPENCSFQAGCSHSVSEAFSVTPAPSRSAFPSSPLRSAQRCQIDGLKLAVVGVFTSQKLANVTKRGSCFPPEIRVTSSHQLGYSISPSESSASNLENRGAVCDLEGALLRCIRQGLARKTKPTPGN